ncbi:lysoplasmalogenase [Treponema sp. TIM-1]|uniref:lysoplasmalogenase n=1 Tax=Treponema sp. TIM-1 TaxID=2898417 RepID=UPI003980CF3F
MEVLGLFCVLGGVHLAFILWGGGRMQGITKALLLPPLAWYYAGAAEKFLVIVLLAVILGWIGDILLLKIKNEAFFKAGLGSFLLGHLLYIPAMLFFAGTVQVPLLIISVIIALPLGILMQRLIKPNKSLRIPVLVYGIIIEMMSLSALQLMAARPGIWGILVFMGSLWFLISDSLLGYFTFRTISKYGSFFIMLFYMLAQGSIIIGLANLGPLSG